MSEYDELVKIGRCRGYKNPEQWAKHLLKGRRNINPKEGLKHDTGKPIAGIMFEDFPNALSGVCDVATFGANKYKRSSWKTVSEAHQRYSDALARHLLAKGKGEVNDPESGLPHSYHIAWNALAIAELEALNAR